MQDDHIYTEKSENCTETDEKNKISPPDYVRLHSYVQKAAISAAICILGIIMFVCSKGDILFIVCGAAFLLIAFLMFMIVRRGIIEFRRTKKEWEESRQSAEENIKTDQNPE